MMAVRSMFLCNSPRQRFSQCWSVWDPFTYSFRTFGALTVRIGGNDVLISVQADVCDYDLLVGIATRAAKWGILDASFAAKVTTLELFDVHSRRGSCKH